MILVRADDQAVFDFDREHAHWVTAHWVTSMLPPLLHIPASAAGATHELARLLVREVGDRRAARGFVLDRLAQLILVSVLRSLDKTRLRNRAAARLSRFVAPHLRPNPSGRRSSTPARARPRTGFKKIDDPAHGRK